MGTQLGISNSVLREDNHQQSFPDETTQSFVQRPINVLLLGAGIQNVNRGVSALGTACVDNLTRAFPNIRIMLVERGMSQNLAVELPDRTVNVETSWLMGLPFLSQRSSSRHLTMLYWLRHVLPGFGTTWCTNRTFKQVLSADVIMDITGGDSFAEIYMQSGLKSQFSAKKLAFQFDKPLVLLPQTIGPFHTPGVRRAASKIMNRSALVATRESFGLDELRSLLGPLDNRFVSCPDVAFSMRPMPIEGFSLPLLNENSGPLIGINVSGLLWGSNVGFGIVGDYRALTWRIFEWAMSVPNARVLLVPHVFNKVGSLPTNPDALGEFPELELAHDLKEQACARWGPRVDYVDQVYSAAQLKWIIGHCDFFIGARMHACIGAISQAVPTVTLAYSKKAKGVMGMLQAEELVLDLRDVNSDKILSQIASIFANRTRYRRDLKTKLPPLIQQIEDFFSIVLPSVLRPLLARREVVSVKDALS